MEFGNEELKNVVQTAKENGLQVWTFKKRSGGRIEQVFFTDGTRIGTCHTEFSWVNFGTVHKPSYQNGTGFGLGSSQDNGIKDILRSFDSYPDWADYRYSVRKYESWEEYLKLNTILEYYQL